MRIGFETSSLITDEPAGIARYATQLIPAILKELSPPRDVTLFYKASKLKYRNHWWRLAEAKTRIYHARYWPVRKGLDVFHGVDAFVPNWKGIRKIITIHDLVTMKLVGDHIASEKFRARKKEALERVRDYVDAVVAVSETTRQDVINLLGIHPDRVHLTHPGVDQAYVPQDRDAIERVLGKYAITGEYLVFVGSVSGRKNTARLVDAFAQSQASRSLSLVLAGSISYRGEDTLQAISRNRLRERVRVLDYVVAGDLPALYSGSRGLVFPTLYEGFGLPIVEAMACGAPVLTGKTGAAPEVSGGCALLVDPYDTNDIAQGIDRLLESPPCERDRAIEHARGFTWRRCAQRTLGVYDRIVAGGL
jgi:glycosyltransferase involved in cell wall biosynthesis